MELLVSRFPSLLEDRAVAHNRNEKEPSVSTYTFKRVAAIVLLASVGWASFSVVPAWGQDEINRKVKSKIPPVYPELARRMNISGVVKVMITVSTNGAVRDAKVVGGHPVLANAALEAVKKWHFESATQESTGLVQFRFDPAQ